MAIQQKQVYICDKCREEMESPYVVMEEIPNKERAQIRCGGHIFSVGGQHYCSIPCATNDITDTLLGKWA